MENSFLIQAVVYLSAAVVVVPLAKRLGLGSVLGYLIAGVLIGPFILGFIGSEGEDIMHFAEFGVVMMLFLVGLELEPALLWRMRTSILGMGGLQIGATAAIICVLSMWFGLGWKPSLAIGLIVSLSSTAIVLQSLNERGLMHSAAGQKAFSVLLFQDIAVIPMLAFLPLLAGSGVLVADEPHHASSSFIQDLPPWAYGISVLLAVAMVIVAGKYAISHLLHYIAKTHVRELFIATALLIVVGIAALMSLVGLSPALGTFLAGVVLANSEYRHELESDIEPFKGLLLGLFFIAVGASIDFNLIIARPWLVAGITIGVMLIKGMVLFGIAKIFRVKIDQNLIFTFYLAQVGEFAFVLLSFSSQEGILDQEIINILMAVTAISMALTPLFMLLNERRILPFVGTKEKPEPQADAVDEQNAVIIAGFGRFGNIVGRFLWANGINATVLDNDSDRVEVLRKLGLKVYYGDASRLDLLESAGIAKAKMVIAAMDGPGKNVELADILKKHYPDVYVLARADDRSDAYELMDAGLLKIYRETLDTSLRLGVDALTLLGHRAYRAQRAARIFLKHDEKAMKQLAALRFDRDKYMNFAKDRIAEMEELLMADLRERELHDDSGWDDESLRKEVKAGNFIK